MPDQLHRRLEALDDLDACFDASPELPCGLAADALALRQRARALTDELEALNEVIYATMRTSIQAGRGASALLPWVLPEHGAENASVPVTGFGYDRLDALLSGVFAFEGAGLQSASIDDEMVFYQPTPARHIFRLIDLLRLTADDVLVDLGSGLGHVPLLVAICTAARGVGIEIDGEYVRCARRCAEQLQLRGVSFLQQDARLADLSSGTVFYLHTPFTGSIMRLVLDRLRAEAATRPIRICTYGPCTAVVAREQWLHAVTATQMDEIAVFASRM